MFLHAALAKCERRLAFWLHHGADLSRSTASHPDWIALEWARDANASPEILRLLAPSIWPSLRPRVFCAGVELDMCARVPGRIDRRCISQLTARSQEHHLLSLQNLRASLAGSRSGHVSRHSLRAAALRGGPRRPTGTTSCFPR